MNIINCSLTNSIFASQCILAAISMRTRISPKISSSYFCSYLLVQFPKECCQFVHSRLPVSKPGFQCPKPGFRCPKPGFRCQNQASGVQKPPLSSGIARHEIACDVSLKICKKQYLNHPQVMNLIEQVLDNAVLSQHDLYFEEYR